MGIESVVKTIVMGYSKGGKTKNRSKNKDNNSIKRELILKEDGQEYALVLKMLGNGRLEALCIDSKTRLCHIRGKMRKKVWISPGDIILLGLRDYQDGKADVILKYNSDEVRCLRTYKELPDHFRTSENDNTNDKEKSEDHFVSFEDYGIASSNEDNESASESLNGV